LASREERARRCIPAIHNERATKRLAKRPLALRVAPHLGSGFVAPQSKIHQGYSPSSRLSPNATQQSVFYPTV